MKGRAECLDAENATRSHICTSPAGRPAADRSLTRSRPPIAARRPQFTGPAGASTEPLAARELLESARDPALRDIFPWNPRAAGSLPVATHRGPTTRSGALHRASLRSNQPGRRFPQHCSRRSVRTGSVARPSASATKPRARNADARRSIQWSEPKGGRARASLRTRSRSPRGFRRLHSRRLRGAISRTPGLLIIAMVSCGQRDHELSRVGDGLASD
jgi:hypothetical protein